MYIYIYTYIYIYVYTYAYTFVSLCRHECATVFHMWILWMAWPVLPGGETCQTRCMLTPLCSVWAIESTTDRYGATTCWHGMLGYNCTWGWKWMWMDGEGGNFWKIDGNGWWVWRVAAWVVPAFGLPVEFDYSKDAANTNETKRQYIYIYVQYLSDQPYANHGQDPSIDPYRPNDDPIFKWK